MIKKISVALFVLCSFGALLYSQDLVKTSIDGLPGFAEEVVGDQLKRPEAEEILPDLVRSLRLSSKQEERLRDAIKKKGVEYDKYAKENDRMEAEEKKFREKKNAARFEMAKITTGMPGFIKDFLDDDQRQRYDEMLSASKKQAEPKQELAKPAELPAPQMTQGEPSAVPAGKKKKRRLVRRKKIKKAAMPGAIEPGAQPPAAEPAVKPAEDDGAGVMVDSEPVPPSARKRRALRKKPVAVEQTEEEPAVEESEDAAPKEDKGDDEEQEGYYP